MKTWNDLDSRIYECTTSQWNQNLRFSTPQDLLKISSGFKHPWQCISTVANHIIGSLSKQAHFPTIMHKNQEPLNPKQSEQRTRWRRKISEYFTQANNGTQHNPGQFKSSEKTATTAAIVRGHRSLTMRKWKD